MSEWPEIWGEASWALDRTNHGLLFEFWSRLGSRRCLTWFHRAEDVELWCTVIRCPIDLKFDGEPIGVILRWSISSDLGAMVPGSFAAGRLDFASEHQNRVKRCRNDLKFDVQPFGSMQKLLMCFVWWVAASEVLAAGRLDFAVRELMEGQTVSVWLEIRHGAFWRYFETIHRLWSKIWCIWHCRRRELPLSCWRIEVRPNGVEMARDFMCTLLLATLKDLVVFVWFCQDLMLEAALPVCSRMRLHIAFDVDEAKWHFWCQQMPPRGTATNYVAFAVDVPRRKLWRRTSNLTKSL